LLSGAEVFELHATYGFPPDLTEIMAEERGMSIDFDAYEVLWEEHRETSRAKDFHAHAVGVGDWKTIHEGSANSFIGYDQLDAIVKIQKIRHIDADKYALLLDKTPFYPESGGQIGDQGKINALSVDLSFQITDTQKSPIGIIHHATLISGQASD